jgi:uncharacterized protein (TIGR02145 family)
MKHAATELVKRRVSMNWVKLLAAVILPLFIANAATLNISGVVKDTAGEAIAGATVILTNARYYTITDEKGRFRLHDGLPTETAQRHYGTANKNTISVKNEIIKISCEKQTDIDIAAYTFHGRILTRIQKTVAAGEHSLKTAIDWLQLVVYEIKTGENKKIIISGGRGVTGTTHTRFSSFLEDNGNKLQKTALKNDTIDDYILVRKGRCDYVDYIMEITNPDTSDIEIILFPCTDTLWDADSNFYQAIQIGNQVWTARNFRTTKYNDGTQILNSPYCFEEGYYLFASDYSYYCPLTPVKGEKDTIARRKDGALYNGYAVKTGKLAPPGWHIPTDAEWDTLQNYLIANGYNWDGTTTGNKIGKALATKTEWDYSPVEGDVGNDRATNNSTGFSAVPSARSSQLCSYPTPHCQVIEEYSRLCDWWSSTQYETGFGVRGLYYENESLINGRGGLIWYYSIRLVRDR